MNFDSFNVKAPLLLGGAFSEAEVFGAAVWLWMQSESHRDAPLHTLKALLLPAIKTQQFMLVEEVGKPVFYLSWADMSADAERRYMSSPPVCMPEADWNSGDRMWILDWVAPFGHTKIMKQLLSQHLFANLSMRSLYHRGKSKGLRVMTFHGMAVMPEEKESWERTHAIEQAPSATRMPIHQKTSV